MGMSGMTMPDMAVYAKPVEKPMQTKSKKRNVTVAEFRNMFNHTTKYYDLWDAADFLNSEDISSEMKLKVFFGEYFADNNSKEVIEMTLNNIKNILKEKEI